MTFLSDPNIRHEFIKTRFLTDPLYYQHGLAKVRLRPLNLHRRGSGLSSVAIPNEQLRKLNILRTKLVVGSAIYSRKNPQEESADLHIRLVKRRMLNGLSAVSQWESVLPTEELICNHLVASVR